MNLSDAITRFVRRYDNPRTAAAYDWVLVRFLDALGDQYLSAVTPERVEDWYFDQRGLGLSPVTVANRVKMIKVFWNWCAGRGYVDRSPARILPSKHPRRSVMDKACSKEALDEMLVIARRNASPFLATRNYALLAFLIQYGPRCIDTTSFRFSRMYEDYFVLVVKGGKEAQHPWTDAVKYAMHEWLEMRNQLDTDPEHDYVWVSTKTSLGNRFQPLHPPAISLIVRNLSQQAGYNFGAHAIRHWRGQSLADAGVPLTITQNLLNHSSSQITADFYYNQGDDRLRRALELHSGLPRPRVDNIIPLPKPSMKSK